MQGMDLTDRKLLNIMQSQFPLVEKPYEDMGQELGITEEEVIERLSVLRGSNVVRQISAIFDTRRLGYKTSLIAMAFDPDKLHAGAIKINEHPGVSHNYAREGSYYNLWFTLAVPPDDSIESTVERMTDETEAQSSRMMPTIRFFKIGVNFDMVEEKGAAYQYYSPDGYNRDSKLKDWNKPVKLSDFDIKAIRELQEDLPMISRPFDAMAQRLEMTVQELFDTCMEFEARGIMRRFSAVLYHREGGFQGQRNGRLEGACSDVRRGGSKDGRSSGGDPLLRTPHVPRLAIYPFHHDPCHF